MPSTINLAIQFLETQWSSINDNKLKGINAELRLERYMATPAIRNLYKYIIPGGWIISPGKKSTINPPTKGRIAILSISTKFSWTRHLSPVPFAAQVLAEAYFQQVGIKTYFSRFDTQGNTDLEQRFIIPSPRNYPLSYQLSFYQVGANGLEEVSFADITDDFPERNGLRGLRAYNQGRIDTNVSPWMDTEIVSQLFWKEYTRYYIQRRCLISANDLDFFIVSVSGKAYPIEFKSKTSVRDQSRGDWFGIDIGPFSKLSFFVSLSNNMEALYIVEEIDDAGNTIEWWGVKFSQLLKYCFWVSQGGGTSMGGGRATTIIVPKIVFEPLTLFLGRL